MVVFFNPQPLNPYREVLCNALEENIKFQFADYVNFVYEKLRVEKYISVMTNTQTAFVKKLLSEVKKGFMKGAALN